MPVFIPKIVAFCCEQSGIPAAEMAETLNLSVHANLEIVPVPCAGRIETVFLLKALERGADGVIVFACYEENCQYLIGNMRAKSRLLYAQNLLQKIGLEKERLEICNIATNSGVKFAETLKDKAIRLKELGPNPLTRINDPLAHANVGIKE